MIYFKKIYFNYDDKANIEAALRKNSIKRTRGLDLGSSKLDIGTDKCFFGYDGKNALYFTRIKSSVEFFLPKIIFSISKNETDIYYGYRLSILPFILVSLFSIGLIIGIISLVAGIPQSEGLISFGVFVMILIALIWAEIKITSLKIKKVIANHQDPQ